MKTNRMIRILPPYLFLLCTFLMIILYFTTTSITVVKFPTNLIGIVFIVLGIGITLQVSRKFKSIDTEIHTFKKPKKLTTKGFFRYTRNPIYLGFLIGLIGVFVVLGSLTSLIGALIFFIFSNNWYIPFEEKQLETEFGEQYKNYKMNVRRWI